MNQGASHLASREILPGVVQSERLSEAEGGWGKEVSKEKRIILSLDILEGRKCKWSYLADYLASANQNFQLTIKVIISKEAETATKSWCAVRGSKGFCLRLVNFSFNKDYHESSMF